MNCPTEGYKCIVIHVVDITVHMMWRFYFSLMYAATCANVYSIVYSAALFLLLILRCLFFAQM